MLVSNLNIIISIVCYCFVLLRAKFLRQNHAGDSCLCMTHIAVEMSAGMQFSFTISERISFVVSILFSVLNRDFVCSNETQLKFDQTKNRMMIVVYSATFSIFI